MGWKGAIAPGYQIKVLGNRIWIHEIMVRPAINFGKTNLGGHYLQGAVELRTPGAIKKHKGTAQNAMMG
jgi:hypothetical protein